MNSLAMGQDHLDQVNLSSWVQESGFWVWDHSGCRRVDGFFSSHNDTFKTRTGAKSFPSVRRKCNCFTGSAHCSLLTQVVDLVLWSMKNGRPLGALRTSQPAGREPDSKEGSRFVTGWGDSWGAGAWDGGALCATGGIDAAFCQVKC